MQNPSQQLHGLTAHAGTMVEVTGIDPNRWCLNVMILENKNYEEFASVIDVTAEKQNPQKRICYQHKRVESRQLCAPRLREGEGSQRTTHTNGRATSDVAMVCRGLWFADHDRRSCCYDGDPD